jgi:hypothetical protein
MRRRARNAGFYSSRLSFSIGSLSLSPNKRFKVTDSCLQDIPCLNSLSLSRLRFDALALGAGVEAQAGLRGVLMPDRNGPAVILQLCGYVVV